VTGLTCSTKRYGLCAADKLPTEFEAFLIGPVNNTTHVVRGPTSKM
jgi:hypothetical protein